jgi:hypothetical protein
MPYKMNNFLQAYFPLNLSILRADNLIYDVRMQTLLDVESKIASAVRREVRLIAC